MRHAILCSMLTVVTFAGCAESMRDEELVVTETAAFTADADYHAQNAQKYYAAGEYRRALSQFRKWAEKAPGDWFAQLGIGLSEYQVARLDVGAGNLRDGAARLAEAERILAELWDGSLEKSTYDKGARQFRACLGLALVERAIGNLDSIRIKTLDGVIMDGTEEEVAKAKAEQERLLRHRKRYYESALDKFTRLTQMEYASPDAWANRAELEFILLDDAAARRSYLAYLDQCRKSIARWEESKKTVREQFPDRRSYAEAVAQIDEKIAGATRRAVDVLRQLALIEFQQHEYASALQRLQEAVRLDPQRFELHVNIAECLAALGNYRDALDHLDTYLVNSPPYEASTRRAYKLRTEYRQKLAVESGGAGREG